MNDIYRSIIVIIRVPFKYFDNHKGEKYGLLWSATN